MPHPALLPKYPSMKPVLVCLLASLATVSLTAAESAAPAAPAAAEKQAPTAKIGANREKREEVPLAAEKLSEFTGVYELNERARFTLVVGDDGHLLARLSAQPFFPLFHSGNDRFFYRIVPAEIQFVRDAGGKITSLTLFQNGRELPAKRSAEAVPTILFPTETELAAYVGTFEFEDTTELKMKARGRQLFGELTGQRELPVFKQRDDYYTSDVVDAGVTFERGADGKVTGVVLHREGQTSRGKKIR